MNLEKAKELIAITKRLLAVPVNRDDLLSSPATSDARKLFKRRESLFGNTGFFLIDTDGNSVGSMRDENLGTRNVIFDRKPGLIERVFRGETLFIPPLISDVAIGESMATMFIAAPVATKDGRVIAVVTQRLVPEKDFSRVLQLGRIGSSGETYSFNRDGLLLSESRFNDHLRQIELIKKDERAILTIEIRDPGGNLLEGYKPVLERNKQPLTLMAASAIKGERGSNVEGYNDYRGVPVFGAWLWSDVLDIGITTEIDVEEALSGYYVMRWTVYLIFTITSLIAIGAMVSTMIFGERANKLLAETYDKVRSELETALVLSDERGRLVQRFANIGFWDWTITTDDLYWSERIAPLFGYKSGEVETTYDNFLAAIHPDDRESVVNAVNNSVGNGAKYDIEHRVVWPDGEVRWLYESGDVMRDEDGKAQRMLGLVQDITTRKAFEDEMQKAKEKAEIAANAKAVFLANMSHEIRTPMNAVIGFTDLALKSPELTGTLKTHVGKANVSAKGLLSVINEILDFSKLDADKLELEEVCFNLPRAMRETVQMFGLQAEQKGINLEFEYSDKLRKCFRGDLTRLRQVVVNLIGNAVKFTDKGSVVLSVEKGEETVHFKIIDTGIGMSPKQAERVFESFTQADGSTARRFGGTGLGTTISKQIVELMGGKIWIESKEGAGSTFNFTIPLPSTDCSKDCIFQEQIEKEIDWSPRLFRILLAEDNVLNSELVEINLVDEQGHEVIWVMDGQAAVERFKEGGIDIILMDYQMPVLDGISATREIRKLEGSTGGHMPIVALTASATMDEQAYFKESGMDVFVKKPINFSELIATMESVVPAGVGTLNTGVPVKSEGTSYISLDPIATVVDINAGLKIWKSQEKYANALAKFARERKDDPAELERLIDAGKINDAKRIAHTLKGLSLGLTDISKSAAEVDAKLKAKDKDAALALLPDLAGVFSIALDAINKIKLPEREVLPKKEFDAKEVGLLFRSLFEGLEEDNPDAVTPVLEGLALYVDDIELNGIKDSVEDFDFPVARIKAIKFAEKLGVN